MKFNDAVFGIFFLVFSSLVLLYSRSLPSLPGYAYGSGFFPAITGVALFICGLFLTARGIRSKEKILVFGDWVRSPKLISNIVLIPLNLVFYIIFANKLGFILTVIAMLTVTIWWLRGKLLSTATVSVCIALFAYLFFYKLMMVPLPVGVLGF